MSATPNGSSASTARSPTGCRRTSSVEGGFAFTDRIPHGVTGHITPRNYPIQLFARTIAPALAAGNACVLKPAEDTPLTSLRAAQIALEAGLPAGVLNVVTGLGAQAGAALADHPDVDHLSFTGSRATGERVMAVSARQMLGCTSTAPAPRATCTPYCHPAAATRSSPPPSTPSRPPPPGCTNGKTLTTRSG